MGKLSRTNHKKCRVGEKLEYWGTSCLVPMEQRRDFKVG